MSVLPDPRQLTLPAGAFVVVPAAGLDLWRLLRESSPTVGDFEERVPERKPGGLVCQRFFARASAISSTGGKRSHNRVPDEGTSPSCI